MSGAPRRAVIALVASLLGIADIPPASAHPHVRIDATASLVFTDGWITDIRVTWTFDPVVSAAMIRDVDIDRDGSFSAAEQAPFALHAFGGIAEYGYFTHLRVDGAERPIVKVENFIASILTGRRVRYNFDVPIADPIDPRRSQTDFSFYDETYYVDVTFGSDSVTIAGTDASDCATSLVRDEAHPIYYGLVIPSLIKVSCTGPPLTAPPTVARVKHVDASVGAANAPHSDQTYSLVVGSIILLGSMGIVVIVHRRRPARRITIRTSNRRTASKIA